ncbi:hypothetical protein [Pseudodesulfovibrio sp.]|uniref:hypothetical protein n=1 Tax=Pseudodesulfovibrio sp. TaxID=2035812 RepID=UPI00260EC102|nr:hypothetical protein [Pseudodesulfovibrio sp.]MDD3313211.1 hypothetical protein [Pseudodesulfovibrio sp.]
MINFVLLAVLFIPAPADGGGGFPHTGTFSSLIYHEEGGDWLGIELLLVETGQGVEGALQFADGEPRPPVLVHPRIEGERISFEYADQGQRGRFRGRFTESGIRPLEPDPQSWWNLRRRPSFWDRYRNETGGDWPSW